MNAPKTILLALLAAAILAGCDRSKPVPQPPKVTAKTEWKAEEIAKDPEGYLRWSDAQVADQIHRRESRLAALSERRAQLEAKQKMLRNNIDDVANVRRRLEEAIQRADDEDRWPARVGEFSFSRDKAQSVLAQTKGYVDDRRPLEQTYSQLFAKMDDAAAGLRKDITDLNRLREKLAIDLEQVRLNAGMAETDQLRKTENQLAAMSKTVAAMSNDDDPLKIAPPKEPPGRVNVDEMLK